MTRFGVAVLILAAALRFWALGHESYWYDEAVSVFNAQAPLRYVPHEVAVRDVSPPLYFLVLALWIKVFGASEVATRALSALGSTLALLLFHRFARRVAGERVAAFAAVLYACAPFSLRFAQEARMYGLLLPLTWAAFELTAAELARPVPRFGRVALVHLALLYTHAFGAFVPLLGLLATLTVRGGRAAVRFAAWHVPVALAFAPWAWVMAEQARARAGGFWIGAPDLKSVHYLVYILAGGCPDASQVPVVEAVSRLAARLAYALVGAGVAGAWWRRAADPRAWAAARVALVGLWLPVALVFVVSHLAQPLFVDRYFLFLAPFFWLSIALAADLAPGRAGWAVVAAYVALTAPVIADHYARPHKEQWREAVAFAQGTGVPADVIVDTGGMTVLIVYLPPGHPRQTTTAIPGFPPGEATPRELLERIGPARTVWMFYSSHGHHPEIYRAALAPGFAELAYRKLEGIAVGCYRKR